MEITQRELKEIHHALWYERFGNHGTVGHNMLILLAKFAKDRGFWLTDGSTVVRPDEVILLPEKDRT